MKRISIIMTIIAALAASSCTQSEDEVLITSNEVQFTAEYPMGTRVSGSAFETGDAMGVYMTQYDGNNAAPLQVSGNYATNSKAVFNGSIWQSSPAIYWGEGKFDVYAYYPYDKPASVDEYSFAVALDQSTPKTANTLGGYEASDFLWAKAEGISRMETVPLTFHHRMSRFVIRLQKGEEYSGDIPSDAVVRIHNTVPVATIDLASGIATKHAYESAQSITAHQDATGVYSAIIVPQRLETRRPLVEVLVSGVSYLIESAFVFKAGIQHTMDITLNNNPDRVRVEIGGEISGSWE